MHPGHCSVSYIHIYHNKTRMSSLKFGKYCIYFGQPLGKGNTGNVYKGINLETQEPLAIKAIQMKKVSGQVAKYLLESQKKALTTIKSPFVIKAYDIMQFEDFCYIAMEHCGKGSLKDYIQHKGKLSSSQAIYLFRKIVTGYIAISQAMFIHRDLKTANILIRDNGDPVIIDFGYCQMMAAKRPTIQYNVGSPSYMAPEVYYRSRYSEKGDVWSLGVILYEMLTGKTLDTGLDMHQFFRIVQKQGIKTNIEGVSQVCQQILQSSLQVLPEKRATCHKLKYIIDKSFIPQVQSQLNKGLTSKADENSKSLFSSKHVPPTVFKYETPKTGAIGQKFRHTHIESSYMASNNGESLKHTQSVTSIRPTERASFNIDSISSNFKPNSFAGFERPQKSDLHFNNFMKPTFMQQEWKQNFPNQFVYQSQQQKNETQQNFQFKVPSTRLKLTINSRFAQNIPSQMNLKIK